MNKLQGYFQSAWYNIRHNKSYALFNIFGTAITFVFVTILLQFNYSVTHNTIPYINADRTVHIYDFQNTKGERLGGITKDELETFIKTIRHATLCATSATQFGNLFTDNSIYSSIITFVNDNFWKVNQFRFLEGRAFTSEEYLNKHPLAIIKDTYAELIFGNKNVTGKHIEFQGIDYSIIGVVKDFSSITNANSGSNVWVPDVFNKYMPDRKRYSDIYILFPPGTHMNTMKEEVESAIKYHFKNKNQEVDISANKILSIKEEKIKIVGNSSFSVGLMSIIFILLIIPAVNIVSLNIANLNNRAQEIAIRRAMGASIFSSFKQILIENLILVIIGTILGVLLTFPMICFFENMFFSTPLTGRISILTELNLYVIILYIFPISILFTFLSGGIPAYLISKSNIVQNLK